MRQWLKAGVLEEGRWSETKKGSPQGGIISPLLANIYLHVLDMYWTQRFSNLGKLVRYADDLVVICRRREEAMRTLEVLKRILTKLKLAPHPMKTRIVKMEEDGFDFLGSISTEAEQAVRQIDSLSWPGRRR